MAPHNAYTDKPEIAFVQTQVSVSDVYDYLGALTFIPLEARRTAAVMFLNESGNGKKGINNNYAGIQADGNRLTPEWELKVTGTVVLTDRSGKLRRFVAFGSWQDSVLFTVTKVYKRGVYIGGTAKPYSGLVVDSANNLSRAYYKEWVVGRGDAEPDNTHTRNFLALYNSVQKNITDSWLNNVYLKIKNFLNA